MKNLMQYEKRTPEIVFEWHDNQTAAVGWLVIDSLKNGAAAGGTRMRVGLDKNEVISLAKTMGLKFAAIGANIGGGKSGINFDPNDPRKHEVLKRWYQAIKPLLKNYYGTGGDLNVDEVAEVIPFTKEAGVLHPIEGWLKGQFDLDEKTILNRIKQLQIGVSKVLDNREYSPDLKHPYKVADMITGYGVAESIKHFYGIYGGDLTNKKVLIQGWGNVGSAAGYYLNKLGAKIVGIMDVGGALSKPEGFTTQEIEQLFKQRKNIFSLNIGKLLTPENTNSLWNSPINVFVPAAASRLIEQIQVEKLLNNGLEVIAPGANVAFKENDIFYGPICKFTDNKVSLIADFVANSGMAEAFWYLMRDDYAQITDEGIFQDVSNTMENLIKKAYSKNTSKTQLTATFLNLFV